MKTALLSSRERVRLALAHQTTDRIPIAMVCAGINAPARADLAAVLQRERGLTVEAYLDGLIDIAGIAPPYVGPALPPEQDLWGVVRKAVSYGPASYSEIDRYPLAEVISARELDAYPWPTTALFDYSALPHLAQRLQAGRERCLMIANGNVFESAWYMRGFERLFMDFLDNPDLAHGILRRVAAFHCAHFERILSAAPGLIDLAFTADDIGGQKGLLMSLPMWEEFIKPYHVQLNQLIHRFGVRVIYHSDGAVMEAVPGLLDMGIDVLQALQFDAAGMDPLALKQHYGERLCFEGGVSVQHTLPFGSAEDVRTEVRQLIDVLGRDGGYILGPSHAIQAGTPAENILALFDTARDYYPY
jgi:uroporphyrinogen decarboxylase